LTIGETIAQLHQSLRDYIEATYHVSHPKLLAQRRALLDEVAVISQRPFIESTPRYKSARPFAEIKGLDDAVLEILRVGSREESAELPRLVDDPPYDHQAASLRDTLVEGKSLVVMTGTGSGKTQCFLLPILGKLAIEAKHRPKSFAVPAARAIVLYPMNALVNDQLGRIRQLLGDPRIVGRFTSWAGRPARFARYTSRTLYPGVRDPDKDKERLAPIGKYYVARLEDSQNPNSPRREAATRLVRELQKRGKWPAKPDLLGWFGKKGAHWGGNGKPYKRCVTLPDDPELVTRHEVHAAAPDVLITNYSMLEYMLMRPLERPIFNQTREWLRNNPHERLLLVLDEAHLYRGAAGAEVALLVRRLRARLGITPERLQVICTSASFNDPAYASEFGAQLTGKDTGSFKTVQGTLALREPATPGSDADAAILASVNLDRLYAATELQAQTAEIQPVLRLRKTKPTTRGIEVDLYDALADYPPLSLLVNTTMTAACAIDKLASDVFPKSTREVAERALTTLLALGSLARRSPKEPGLLPCRVHSFHRGLAGLWVCMDADCSAVPATLRGGPTGALYSQPRESCTCGARVLELYTCRHCGTAYARSYTDNLDRPDFQWSEPGREFRTSTGIVSELEPLDLLLEKPVQADKVERADYDLITGRMNPKELGERMRTVYVRKDRSPPPPKPGEDAPPPSANAHFGEFKPCAVCDEQAAYGRSSVQDHQTKGDQPFQALVTKQIQVQPPGLTKATRFAPLRGRKVLIFSDSRQMAARLAPNLQTYSMQDVLRPLLVVGFQRLQANAIVRDLLSLEDSFLAVLLAATELGVRLRPELKDGEVFTAEGDVQRAVEQKALERQADALRLLMNTRTARAPEALLKGILTCLTDRYYGLEAFALGSVVEAPVHAQKIGSELPDLPGVATSPAEKTQVVRAWLRCWRKDGFWLGAMPTGWWLTEVTPHKTGNFDSMKSLLPKAVRKAFEAEWLPKLRSWFTEPADGKFRLHGRELLLGFDGAWAYCQTCRSVHHPLPGRSACIDCGRDTARIIDPETDPVFSARKGYYRASTIAAVKRSDPPFALIAKEHTAQLNVAQAQEVFSRAEEHELLFQDVDLGPDENGRERSAIDVLSCTTTMEVGIDIGTLSGVALRNMPPARANYQQRAGRAGRRGNAVATVMAFGSADSHDEHYFTNPSEMIRGKVDDPKLTLNNYEIVRRHVTAYLLQRYHEARLPEIEPEEQPHLFAVLGKVDDFKSPNALLNRGDLASWLRESEGLLRTEVSSWLPSELGTAERQRLLENLVTETMAPIDDALGSAVDPEGGDSDSAPAATPGSATPKKAAGPAPRRGGRPPASPTTPTRAEKAATEGVQTPAPVAPPAADAVEAPPEEGENQRDPLKENLLDRLLYKGVLPRYAFPTDVASFHVFNRADSTPFRPAFHFTPSQGLSMALSQYAPDKEVWVAGKRFRSGAIYSPIKHERSRAWQTKRLYLECSICGYARTFTLTEGTRGETRDCEACGGAGTFGAARYWIRPPGFAHPVDLPEDVALDDQPPKSYATRAKLTAPTPSDPTRWSAVNERLRVSHLKEHLLVSNRGPRNEGYTYCTFCGRIEATAAPRGLVAGAHPKPFPDDRDPTCPGGRATKGLILGTDFITDVLLISLVVQEPMSVRPGLLSTDVALRTVCEALAKAACTCLNLEPGELMAEYRPALTPAGRDGLEVEIFLYDTLPGGAGFARQVAERGRQVFEEALRLLENCPYDCDRSCYRCLRSFKNKFEHELLDRSIGASLLGYALTGRLPVLDGRRLTKVSTLLYEDLRRQTDDVEFAQDAPIDVPGFGRVVAPILAKHGGRSYVVALTGALTPTEASDQILRDLAECSSTPVLLVDELTTRRNLPRASGQMLERLGVSAS
jgi:ATP-dependent helicase YprA (DUF1998 family)